MKKEKIKTYDTATYTKVNISGKTLGERTKEFIEKYREVFEKLANK